MAMQLLRRALPFHQAGLRSIGTYVAGESAVTLPALPYEYSALEPSISSDIMELHHKKHHQAYVTNYNKALEQWKEAEKSQDSNALPKISSALHFNGGGALSEMSEALSRQTSGTAKCASKQPTQRGDLAAGSYGYIEERVLCCTCRACLRVAGCL